MQTASKETREDYVNASLRKMRRVRPEFDILVHIDSLAIDIAKRYLDGNFDRLVAEVDSREVRSPHVATDISRKTRNKGRRQKMRSEEKRNWTRKKNYRKRNYIFGKHKENSTILFVHIVL